MGPPTIFPSNRQDYLMITRNELDRLVSCLPKNLSTEERRIATCVATGAHYDKSLPEIVKFYSLNRETATEWWDKFNFNDFNKSKTFEKKSKPQKVLQDFVKSNINQEVTANHLAEACEVSLPTVYTFITNNRGWFKKIARGLYLIVDAEKEREKQKK